MKTSTSNVPKVMTPLELSKWRASFYSISIVIAYMLMRAIRGSQDRMEHDIRDLKFRVGQVEQTLAQHGTLLAHYSARFDSIDTRLDHIEQRLGLVDA
jgi:hypothetical protein